MKSIFLIVALLALNSCGKADKKEVSKENFTKVLNDYYARDCIGIDMDANLPMHESEEIIRINHKYTELEKLGLLKLTDAKFNLRKEEERRGDPFLSDKDKIAKGKKIELTEKGKKIYKVIKNTGRKEAKFCLANYQVVEITNYTKPESVMGITLSRVNYTAKPTKVVPYIDEVSKIDSFKYYKKLTSKEISQRADLILTEMKGWIHNSEFKR